MKVLSDYFYAKSSWLAGLLFTVLTMLYLGFVMMPASECQAVDGLAQFTVNFGYSKETIVTYFSRLGEEGLNCFRQLVIVYDNIFPLLYNGVFIAWISYLFRDYVGRLWWINVFPIVLIVVDWLENTHAYILAGQFQAGSDLSNAMVSIGSGLTMLKWVVFLLCCLILIAGISYRVKSYFVKTKTSA